jgi:hypothetical protein
MNGFTKFLKDLIKIAPRRGKKEQEAAQLIKSYLDKADIKHTSQNFETEIPVIKSAFLHADGKEIPCIGCSFKSGKISSKAPIINPYKSPDIDYTEKIVFNPISVGICLNSYQDVPAVAINRESFIDLLMSQKYEASIKVNRERYSSENIIVGNTKDPRAIVVAHYDSIVGSGAVDNAAAVDVLYQTILARPDLLENNLFLFAGNEEESYSSSYGFYGFEVFDREYRHTMLSAEKITVLDGVGVGKPTIVSHHTDWAFEVPDMSGIKEKVRWLQNDQSIVMKYYHTKDDTLDKLAPKFIHSAKDLVIESL